MSNRPRSRLFLGVFLASGIASAQAPSSTAGASAPAAASEHETAESDEWSIYDTRFLVVAERLFGLYSISGTQDVKDERGQRHVTDFSTTQANVLYSESFDRILLVNPMAVSHLSLHGVVWRRVTLGGGIGYAYDSGQAQTQGGPEQNAPQLSLVFIGPKIGYLLAIVPGVSIWLRGGVTYYTEKTEQHNEGFDFEGRQSGTYVGLDPMFVFSPIPHVGFLAGPIVDVGLFGSQFTKTTDMNGTRGITGDLKWNQFAVAAGVAVLL